ncbi:MAG: AMP-binding protein, partial [Acidobacteria bacterium]|nr:AMP-binding protein [Acidobacteriota bacterium]
MSSKNVEDVYPLSPLQEGMLFEEIYSPGSDVYIFQIGCELEGSLDPGAFERAWQQVVDRHPVLRTAFAWEKIARPVQLVGKSAKVPLVYEDWREVPAAEQEERWRRFVEDDRRRGIELQRAPLMRVALVRRAENLHSFLWTVHHLVVDGWSFPLVLQEVFTLYYAHTNGGRLDGGAAAAARLPRRRPFRQYIAWLQKQDAAQAEAFWRERLGDFAAATPLGVDRKRELPAGEDPYGLAQRRFSPELTEAVQALARRHGLTLNTVVEGLWALLLSHYSGRRDVVYGSIGSGRPVDLPQVEEMIGLFVATLPLRTVVDPDRSLVPWLEELQARHAEARQYEYSPLAKIQRWSGVAPGERLFESVVSFQNAPLAAALEGGEGLKARRVETSEKPGFPIILVVMPDERLQLEAQYDRRRFSEPVIERLLAHVERLAEQVTASPEARLGDLSPLTAAERQELLVVRNATERSFPAETTLHALVAQRGAQDPAAPAVVCGDEVLSHGELARRSRRLAHELRRLGVGPETVVGLALDRSPGLVVGMLGILEAGGAYLPLDPVYPADRLAFMLEDSGARVLVTRGGLRTPLADLLERFDGAVVDLAALETGDDSALEPLTASLAGPDNLAYVIYTSGSTGRPKGVLVDHRSLVNYALEMVRCFGLDEHDRVLQFASPSFDVLVEEVFPTLLAGASVVLHGSDLLLSVAELQRVLERQKVTLLELPAAYWHEWVRELAATGSKPPASVRLLLLGSEKPNPERLAAWVRMGVPLIYVFGLTETTVTNTIFRLEVSGAAAPGLDLPLALDLPIGRPVANNRVYVVDDRLEPVAPLVTGELLVGGVGVARGYHGRP